MAIITLYKFYELGLIHVSHRIVAYTVVKKTRTLHFLSYLVIVCRRVSKMNFELSSELDLKIF